jgi:hypothetical protein
MVARRNDCIRFWVLSLEEWDQNSAKPNRASDHGEVSRGGEAREIFSSSSNKQHSQVILPAKVNLLRAARSDQTTVSQSIKPFKHGPILPPSEGCPLSIRVLNFQREAVLMVAQLPAIDN